MSNSIETETSSGAFVIRFTRPEIRNPLSIEVLAELERLLDAIRATSKLVFVGSGGVFASGADLREIDALSPDHAAEFSRRGQALMDRIAAIRVPTIAAIDGPCFGGALDLALACDRRIASPNATFCHPGSGLGIITGWGGTQRLPRLVGEAKALEMFFTASPLNSAEALRIGLIDEIAARVEDAILPIKIPDSGSLG
jgi:enoyl-CoA hydratase